MLCIVWHRTVQRTGSYSPCSTCFILIKSVPPSQVFLAWRLCNSSKPQILLPLNLESAFSQGLNPKAVTVWDTATWAILCERFGNASEKCTWWSRLFGYMSSDSYSAKVVLWRASHKSLGCDEWACAQYLVSSKFVFEILVDGFLCSFEYTEGIEKI